jgi:predicted ATP-binding protein involved in virulence
MITIANIRKSSDTCSLQPRYPVEVEATGIIYDQKLTWMRSLNGTNGRTTKVHAADVYSVARDCLNRVRLGDKALILPLISYYGTGRLWAQKKNKRDDTLSKRSNRLLGYEDCLSAESNEKLMLRWFEKATIKEFQNEGAGTDLLSVRQAVEECCQRLMGTDKIRIQYNLDTKEIDVIDRSQDGKAKRFPMHELSDGLRNTISMIADIAYRMAVLNPQLKNPVKETSGIVLIDEVDLHLHPQWQQRITGILTEIFPKIQFIVTTHAPAVIASVRKENVLILNDS